MEKKPEQFHPDNWLRDLPPASQVEGFKTEEMIACPKCARMSPPNRLRCFYCNAELPAADPGLIKPNLRRLETWEKGFNVILLPKGETPTGEPFTEIAGWLRIEPEEALRLFSAGKPLPATRAESEREAQIIVEKLRAVGFDSFVVSDEKLAGEIAPRRLRALEFSGDNLILVLFNSGEKAEIAAEDLNLIVSGELTIRKIEATEKYRRREENKILETSEMSSDELMIDIYDRRDPGGFRIVSKGFDFSCLGAEKRLLVRENMKKLAEKLRDFAPQAKFDDDYQKFRPDLSRVWEAGESKDSTGLQRKGFGKFNLGSVTTLDNQSQFTKYSRLQWHLL